MRGEEKGYQYSFLTPSPNIFIKMPDDGFPDGVTDDVTDGVTR
jgi:hypothetical protein